MQISNISIRLLPLPSLQHVEIDSSNNDLINGPVRITYAAIADFDISSLYVYFIFYIEVYNNTSMDLLALEKAIIT